MQAIEFQGFRHLVALIDSAVAEQEAAAITATLGRGIGALLDSGALHLPPQAVLAAPDHHARRLLYRSEAHGYVVIAMTWAPGQGSPIHDHAGAWGMETVLSGEIEEQRYALLRQDSGYWRLRGAAPRRSAAGSCDQLIPQQDYHRVSNPSSSQAAVTLNIYSRDLTHCRTFKHEREELYTCKLGRLAYDPWEPDHSRSRPEPRPFAWAAEGAGLQGGAR